MSLPEGELPDGPAADILAWCAGNRVRLEFAYSVELKKAEPRNDVVRVLDRALMRIGYFGEQATERTS